MLFRKTNYNKYLNNKEKLFKNNFLFAVFVILSVGGFLFFLITTELIFSTLLIFLLSIIIIYPYTKLPSINKNDSIIKLYFIIFISLFVLWLMIILGTTIVPFFIALTIGYLLDPFVSKLEKIGIKRWLSSLCIIIIFIGFITTLSIFLFPQLIEQVSNITKQVNIYVEDVKQFSTNKDTIAMLKQFGLSKNTLKEAFDTELLPVIQNLSKTILNYLFKLLLSISNITMQVVNLIILPILTFYFLKDFTKIKNKIKTSIKNENEVLYKYLNKLNKLIRIYIGWQIIAAFIVMIFGSIILTILNIPYGILIACITGILNPIPFFGTIISLAISALISLLVSDGNFFYNFGIISIVLLTIHFINAYLLEPNIAGNKIGLHPIIMILSVFIFNSLFGVLGMLVAVPITAVIVAFVKDMLEYYQTIKEK